LNKRLFDVVTFDCYGTLIDWDAGIAGAFLSAAAADGVALDRATVLGAYAGIEPKVQAEGYRSYRDVLGETARRVAAQLGWSLTPGRTDFLTEGLPDWPPFSDTRPALVRLAGAGYRLGILSNVDDDLLAGTCRHLGVPIELRVTAQGVRSYKPAHAHFLAARDRIGASRWLHAAQSYFHDVQPALGIEIPVAWVNRKGEAPPAGQPAPIRTLANLEELADWLAP